MLLGGTPERVEAERHLRDVARLKQVRRLEDLLVADAVILHRFLNGRGSHSFTRKSNIQPQIVA